VERKAAPNLANDAGCVITQAILTSLTTKFQPVLLKYAREGEGGKVKSVGTEGERESAKGARAAGIRVETTLGII